MYRPTITTLVAVAAVSAALLLPLEADAATLRTPPNNLGLVGYWSFEDGEGNTATDFSGQGNDGALTNMDASTDWVNGKRGTALDFDKVDDQVHINNNGVLDDIDHITITAWIKLRTTGEDVNGGRIVDKSPVNNDFIFTLDGSKRLSFTARRWDGNEGQWFTPQNSINLSTWQHVAVTYKYNSTAENPILYINGETVSISENVTPSGSVVSEPGELAIGNGANYTTHTFDGKIDEVRIYNRVLAASEIRDLYESGLAKVNTSRELENITGLVGWWTFDGNHIGDTIEDASGTGNNGYFINGATSSAKTIGRIGQALEFDGVDDYVDAGTSVEQFSQTYSLFAWVKVNTPPASGNRDVIFQNSTFGSNGKQNSSLVYRNNSGTLQLFTNWRNAADTDWSDWKYDTDLGTGEWNFVGVTVDTSSSPDTVRHWINGEGFDSTNVFGSNDNDIITGESTEAYIGRGPSASNEFFNGKIDEVRLYNRTLTDAEISRIYNATRPSHINTSRNDRLTDGLVGMWSFDGPDIDWSTNTATDASGNGNNGTINGAKAAIGKIGQALEFDGSDDQVNIPDAPSMEITDSITVSGWVKVKTYTEEDTVIHNRRNASNNDGGWTLQANTVRDVWEFFVQISGVGYRSADFPKSEVGTGTWHHIVGTYDGNTIRIYLDGTQKDSTTQSGTINNPSSPTNAIGYSPFVSDYADTKIDNVRIYNRALSAEEVKRLYRLGR